LSIKTSTLARPRLGPASHIGLGCLFAAAGLLAGSQMASTTTRPIAVLAAAALVYLAFFLWQPTVAILGYIALRPLVDAFVFQSYHGFTLGVLWGIGMVVSASLFLVMESADRVHRMRVAAVPIAFLFILAVLTFTRPEFPTAVSDWTKVASWILVLLVCERIASDRAGQLRCWWAGIVMACVLVVAVGIMIVQHRYGSTFYADALSQITGEPPHPLSLTAVLLLPLALSGALVVGRRRLSLSIAAGLLAAIILSYVRTAYIGGFLVLGALVAVAVRGRGRASAFAIAAVLGLGVAVYAMWGRISARFSDLTLLADSGAARAGAGSGRIGIWRAALNGSFDTVQHAIIGRGRWDAEQLMIKAIGSHVGAHNDLLDYLLVGGVVLGIAWLVMLAWMIATPLHVLRDRRQSSDAKAFAGLMLGGAAAFVLMSMVNAIAPYQASIAAGLLLGLTRGVMVTPGETFLDPDSCRPGSATALTHPALDAKGGLAEQLVHQSSDVV